MELFFDLVFVFALAGLSQGLLERLNWSDAFQTLVLLLALWSVWINTAGLTDRFDPQQPLIQLLVLATMFGTLMMAAAVPEAFHEQGLFFAGAYVATQTGRGAVAVLLLRGHEARAPFVRALFWSGVSAVPWIAGAVAHDTARGVLWALAVAVEYVAIALGLPTPRLGRAFMRAAEYAISGEHLAERCRQLFIIALGEVILRNATTTAAIWSGSNLLRLKVSPVTSPQPCCGGSTSTVPGACWRRRSQPPPTQSAPLPARCTATW
ncbi:low temperature requirement protein A [Micromonospora sp. IBSANI012]|uniref:low temperature requirement protein A n=1 Tax=Micromonospora sp. IBSANI012 TaxID=3457761 RepID=UPI004058761B